MKGEEDIAMIPRPSEAVDTTVSVDYNSRGNQGCCSRCIQKIQVWIELDIKKNFLLFWYFFLNAFTILGYHCWKHGKILLLVWKNYFKVPCFFHSIVHFDHWHCKHRSLEYENGKQWLETLVRLNYVPDYWDC